MSSVYFPAHVVVLFRRIVNVVSTISISNQYMLSTQMSRADDALQPNVGPSDWKASVPSKQLFTDFRNIEWPWWTRGNDVSVVGEDIRALREIQKTQKLSGDDYGRTLKGVSTIVYGMIE